MPKRVPGNKEAQLRAEIASCEKLATHYQQKLARIKKVGYHWLEDECLNSINHYIGRRKWLIGQLVKLQIGEFDGKNVHRGD